MSSPIRLLRVVLDGGSDQGVLEIEVLHSELCHPYW